MTDINFIKILATKTDKKNELQEIINELHNTPCTFWACEGSKRPYENMITCNKCALTKKLRNLKAQL